MGRLWVSLECVPCAKRGTCLYAQSFVNENVKFAKVRNTDLGPFLVCLYEIAHCRAQIPGNLRFEAFSKQILGYGTVYLFDKGWRDGERARLHAFFDYLLYLRIERVAQVIKVGSVQSMMFTRVFESVFTI